MGRKISFGLAERQGELSMMDVSAFSAHQRRKSAPSQDSENFSKMTPSVKQSKPSLQKDTNPFVQVGGSCSPSHPTAAGVGGRCWGLITMGWDVVCVCPAVAAGGPSSPSQKQRQEMLGPMLWLRPEVGGQEKGAGPGFGSCWPGLGL